MRVVQLTGLRDLSISSDRGIGPSQMRKCRRIRIPVEYLRYTDLALHCLGLLSPVSGRQGILEPLRDDALVDGSHDVEHATLIRALRGVEIPKSGKIHQGSSRAITDSPFASFGKYLW